MSKFAYKAKRGPDDIIEGDMDADSVDTVVERLGNNGYIPFSIVEEGRVDTNSAGHKGSRKKVKRKDINIFTRQLANLLKSKISLPRALNIIYDHTANINMKKIIMELFETVKGGGSLSDVMIKYPKHFSILYINTVRSGEIGCVLEESLERLSAFADKDEEFRSKIRIAIAYPIFMLLTGIGTIVVLLTFVMPKLIGMFEDMGQKLPLPTRIVMGMSSFMENYWYILLIGAALFFYLMKKRGLSEKEQYAIDKMKLNIPVIGNLVRETEIAKFARTTSLLLDNGVSLHQAVDATIPTLSNLIIKGELKKVSVAIISGDSLSRSLQRGSVFPPFVLSMITVGEEGGRLSSSLNEVADYYEREGDQAMKIVSSLVEPVMILGMGLIIGFMVISMLLPVFELNVLSGK